MKLRYITCSDPREHNSIDSIMELAQLPNAEIAVQCHPSKMSKGMPRNVWFEELLSHAYWAEKPINLAIHINAEWAYSICVAGKIPDIVLDWFKAQMCYDMPLIQRIQLNMSKAAADNTNVETLAKIIHDFPKQEFILQYNDKTKDTVEKLHQTGAHFSLLFDASGGNGISPTTWQKPVYRTHPMGYSGGISPLNVIQNLDSISKVVPLFRKVWIDAEGKLKSPNLFTEKPAFDVSLAADYVNRANLWQRTR